MSNLVQLFSGRKRSSGVWTYFSYDEKQNKSKCLISECSMTVATKNATNLKNHLRKHHKDAYEEIAAIDEEQQKKCSSAKRLKTEG